MNRLRFTIAVLLILFEVQMSAQDTYNDEPLTYGVLRYFFV